MQKSDPVMLMTVRSVSVALLAMCCVALLSVSASAQSNHFKLIRAVERNNYDDALKYLKEGITPNTRTRTEGIPALVIAAREGHSRMLTLLLEWDANPDIQDRERGETALMVRTGAGDVDDVRTLLDGGATPNVGDKSRETALTRAVRLRYHRIATLLMEAGADIDVVDVTGNSPLDYAKQNRDRRMIKILEETAAKKKPAAPASGPMAGPRPGPGRF